MKVGLIPGTAGTFATSGAEVRALARATEAAGFDSIWLGEHVVLPAVPDEPYPGEKEGLAGPTSGALPDPLEWLAFAAATTDHLLLGTSIVIVPLHNPLILAKRLATLDQLSGGRVRLGIGVGWNRQEFDALGVPWAHRGRRCDEAIAAMRALWRDTPASFRGEHVSFEPVYSSPKPVGASVPVLVGGNSDVAARRAGRIGDGYFPFERDFDRLVDLIAAMRVAAEQAGRDPDAIEITSLGSIRAERVAKLAAAGVHRMVLFMADHDVESVAALGARSRAVVDSL
jgi:probable F420-dependent oxidoreductase